MLFQCVFVQLFRSEDLLDFDLFSGNPVSVSLWCVGCMSMSNVSDTLHYFVTYLQLAHCPEMDKAYLNARAKCPL